MPGVVEKYISHKKYPYLNETLRVFKTLRVFQIPNSIQQKIMSFYQIILSFPEQVDS